MKHSMRALLVLLVIVQMVAFCAVGAAEGLPEITGIVVGFDGEGMPVMVSDDGKDVKYVLAMNPSVKMSDIEVFTNDLRIAVTAKAIQQDKDPIVIEPTAVRGLPNLPVYAGLVERMDAAQGRLLARMQDGRAVWVAPHAGMDINEFGDRGILFFLADGDSLPTSEADVANAVWCKSLDVYRGTFDAVNTEAYGLIALHGDAAFDTEMDWNPVAEWNDVAAKSTSSVASTSSVGTVMMPYIYYERTDAIREGDAVIALFDRSTLCLFALLKDGA